MSQNSERDARHRRQMARKKAVVDAGIARATEKRGIVLVHTGNGKGTSAAAFGMAARALGHGMRVGVVQFIGGGASGEEAFFRRFPEVSYHALEEDGEHGIAAAGHAWRRALAILTDPASDLVVLDEINVALELGYLDVSAVLAALRARPPMQHVVLTGHGAPPELIEFADTVTEMCDITHAFGGESQARAGVGS